MTIDSYYSIFYFLGEFLLKFSEGIVENEPEVTPKPRLIAKNNLFYPIQKRSSSTKSSASSSKRFKTLTIHQITGSERIELAKEILANHNGSATKYRFHLQTLAENSDEIINITSVDVYKKIVQEYNNRDDISPDWRQNLKTLKTTYLGSIETAKKLKGEFH